MLDLVQLLRAYIYSALSAVPGYKALLVDKDTMRMCSMLLGRSELADRDVVHVEQLDHPTSSKKSHQELKVSRELFIPYEKKLQTEHTRNDALELQVVSSRAHPTATTMWHEARALCISPRKERKEKPMPAKRLRALRKGPLLASLQGSHQRAPKRKLDTASLGESHVKHALTLLLPLLTAKRPAPRPPKSPLKMKSILHQPAESHPPSRDSRSRCAEGACTRGSCEFMPHTWSLPLYFCRKHCGILKANMPCSVQTAIAFSSAGRFAKAALPMVLAHNAQPTVPNTTILLCRFPSLHASSACFQSTIMLRNVWSLPSAPLTMN
eukprot:458237-Pelagomonas_calceolata.AAC.15